MPWRAAWGTSRGKLCVCAVKGHHTYSHTHTEPYQSCTAVYCFILFTCFSPVFALSHSLTLYITGSTVRPSNIKRNVHFFFLNFHLSLRRNCIEQIFFFKGEAALIISSEMISLNTDKKKRRDKKTVTAGAN